MTTDLNLTSIWDIIRTNNFVVLDTETTGLKYPAEICQVAILDFMGEEIFNTLVHTANLIPRDATAIHGITNEQVATAPYWTELRPEITNLIEGKYVLTYNADFDLQMFMNSDRVSLINSIPWGTISSWRCVMKWYAEIYGDWNDYHRSYRWQTLQRACIQQGVHTLEAHSALCDAKMTHGLLVKLRRQRAVESIIRVEIGNQDCEHSIIDNTVNGYLECRDCGHRFEV